jgi:hypothetical protein
LRTRKTTNFDACRDLSGRRLRHAKAEERLKEWAIKQAEKQKALEAEAAAAKADKMLHKQQVVHAFASESQQLSARTASALQRGLLAKHKTALGEARNEARRELASKAQHNPWDLLLDEHDQQQDDEQDDEEEDEDATNQDYVIHDEVTFLFPPPPPFFLHWTYLGENTGPCDVRQLQLCHNWTTVSFSDKRRL